MLPLITILTEFFQFNSNLSLATFVGSRLLRRARIEAGSKVDIDVELKVSFPELCYFSRKTKMGLRIIYATVLDNCI